jgi:uncharacterized protein (DUF58 family)
MLGGILDRVRTPAEPGPGSLTSGSLKALDIVIGRRISGTLSGDFRSAFAGVGTEFHQVRPYQVGDDVRRIDWNVTARLGEPYVRVELVDTALVTWLVLDASASMRFGTADRRKVDVAEGAAIAIGHAATRRGNRLGVVSFGPEEPSYSKPRPGRNGLLAALLSLDAVPSGTGSLGDALMTVGGLALQRSLVVVISDFRGSFDWRSQLLHLAARHPTLAIEIRDPREQRLPDVGELRVVDPETGDPLFRARFAQAADEERQALATLLASTGVRHVSLSTEGDWFPALAAFLSRGSNR